MQSMPTSPVSPMAAAPFRGSEWARTRVGPGKGREGPAAMKGIKSVYQLCAHCWPSNSSLVSDLDWLFSVKETKDNQKRVPRLGESPEFRSNSEKERWKNVEPLTRLWDPWAGQAEPRVLLASPASPSGCPSSDLPQRGWKQNKNQVSQTPCPIPPALLISHKSLRHLVSGLP